MSTLPTSPAPRPRPSLPAGRPLDDGWRQWVAENRLRGCTPDSMLATMLGAGLDGQASVAALQALEHDPVYHAALRHQQLLRKLESVVENLQKLWQLAPGYATVEKRERLSRDEFIERYVIGCRPVVITGLARDWPALQRWSPQDLKQRFGHLEVEVQAERQADPNYEQNKLQHRRRVRLGDFVDHVLARGPSNDHYLTANNELLRRPEFAPLLQDIGSLPDYCDAAALERSCSFWFGPAGTVTPLHHDTLMLFHTQVVGRKRWRFVSPLQTPKLYNYYDVYSPVDPERPDLHRYPDFAEATVLDVVVEPGETMFLPLGWWHQVTSLDLSLSFSFSNPAVPNEYRYRNPDIRNW
ncbi:MAG: cupin-like domain-containing protein [Burkholderiales bacterium]|nr:cupin-like domain-containing protein [Burkholderiales bacterium]